MILFPGQIENEPSVQFGVFVNRLLPIPENYQSNIVPQIPLSDRTHQNTISSIQSKVVTTKDKKNVAKKGSGETTKHVTLIKSHSKRLPNEHKQKAVAKKANPKLENFVRHIEIEETKGLFRIHGRTVYKIKVDSYLAADSNLRSITKDRTLGACYKSCAADSQCGGILYNNRIKRCYIHMPEAVCVKTIRKTGWINVLFIQCGEFSWLINWIFSS